MHKTFSMVEFTLLFVLFTFLLPLMCEARIKINITVGASASDTKIEYGGIDNKLISDMEIDMFNFTKAKLNKGMRIELGRVPDDIFWKDPTPYDNLYGLFEWPQVNRNLRIEKAKVIAVVNENVTIKVSDHINNTNRTTKTKVVVTDLLENNIAISWSAKGLPKDEMYFDVEIEFTKHKYKFQDKWRNRTFKTVALPFGIYKEGSKSIMLKPGHIVTSRLSGLQTILLIEVEYLGKLIGNLIADYENLYGKYHFYAPTVHNIMKAANMTNEIKTTQWIEIRCYTNPKLEVFDKRTGKAVKLIEHSPFQSLNDKHKYVNIINRSKHYINK